MTTKIEVWVTETVRYRTLLEVPDEFADEEGGIDEWLSDEENWVDAERDSFSVEERDVDSWDQR